MTTRPYFAVVERYVTRAFSQEALGKELEDAMGPLQRTILLLPQSEFRTQIGYVTVIYRGAFNFAPNTFTTDPDETSAEPQRGNISFVVYGPNFVNYIALEDMPWMLREANRQQWTIALVRGGFRGERGRIVFQGRQQYEMGWNDTERCVAPPPSRFEEQRQALEQSLDARILVVPEDRIDWQQLLPDSRLRQLTAKGFRQIAQNLNAREEFQLWDQRTYPESGREFRGVRSSIRSLAAWLETNHVQLTPDQRMEILVNIADIVKRGIPVRAIIPLPPQQQQPRAEYRSTLN